MNVPTKILKLYSLDYTSANNSNGNIKRQIQSRLIKWSYKTCKYKYDSAYQWQTNNKIYHFHTVSKIKLNVYCNIYKVFHLICCFINCNCSKSIMLSLLSLKCCKLQNYVLLLLFINNRCLLHCKDRLRYFWRLHNKLDIQHLWFAFD